LLEEEDVGVNSMNEEVQQLQNNINKLKHEITDLTNKKLEYSSKQGQIKGEMEVMESKRAMRDELIKNNSEKIDFEPTNDEDFAGEFLDEYQKYIKSQQKSMNKMQTEYDEKISVCEEKWNEAQEKLTESKMAVKHAKETLINKKQSHAKNLRELSRLKSASENDELETLQVKLDEAQERLSEAQSSGIDVDEVRMEIKKLTKESKQDQMRRDKIDKEITMLHKTSETRMKISMFEKEMERKEASVRENSEECRKNLKKFGFTSKLPTSSSLDNLVVEKEEESQNLRQELDEKRTELGRLRAKMDMMTTETKEKQDRINF